MSARAIWREHSSPTIKACFDAATRACQRVGSRLHWPGRLGSTQARIFGGFVVLLGLQLGVAFVVWDADRQLDRSMAADARAVGAGLMLNEIRSAFAGARLDLSEYLRSGSGAEQAAVLDRLAKLGAATSNQLGGETSDLYRPVSMAVRSAGDALREAVLAAEARRAALANLRQASASLQNTTATLTEFVMRSDDPEQVDSGIAVEEAVGPVLVAVAHHASGQDPRDAEIARSDLALARDRVAVLRQAAVFGPHRLQSLADAEAAALDAVAASLDTVANVLAAHARSQSALDRSSIRLADAIAEVDHVSSGARDLRHNQTASARVALRCIVLVGTLASLGIGLALSWLTGAERRRAADGLKQAHLCLDAALNNMSQGLCMYDAEQRLRVYNRRYCEIFGFRPEQLHLGMSFRENIELGVATGHQRGQSVDDIYQERVALIERRVSNSTVLELRNDLVIAVWQECMPSGGWVVTYEDITERRRNEAQLVHMARHDALTGLPNRVMLRERAGQELAGVGRGERLGVMCLDLDQFKTVNDTLGHPIGDALLQAVAARLLTSVRDGDMVARLGGDEFAVLQIGLDGPEQAGVLAARIIELLSQPFDLNGHQVVVGASIGIALAPDDSDNADTLMRSADMALYRAKTDGRGTYRFFELEMDARLQARRTLELDLRRAVANQEFELYYQPLVDLGSDRITGVEALVRWHHPERGMVSPVEFIPLAEEIGLIVPLGEWVLNEACATAAGWWSGSQDGVKVAVNLSAAQFRSRNLVQAVMDALAASGLPANMLELEITESLMLEDSQTVMNILHRLRALGVRISMDDFGTGYSSLSYLRSFPFDKIKIDQSFVRDLLEHKDSSAIVRAVVGLGNSLGMSTTAEGVETEEQLTRLRQEGCKEVQGYLFSPPKPASEIAAMLAHDASRRTPAEPA